MLKNGAFPAELIDPLIGRNGSRENEVRELQENFLNTYPVDQWIIHGYFTNNYTHSIDPHWLQFAPQSHLAHYMLAVLYLILMVVGVVGNLFVIFLFFKCKSLRTPGNILVFNLAISDGLMMLKMPVFIYNSLYFGPALGENACRLYGFVGGLSGTCSICTISAISLDRYYVIRYPLKNRFSSLRAKVCAVLCWIYALIFSSIPLMELGYSKYSPEGFLTSCSFNYLSPDIRVKRFILLFFVAAFVVPFTIILFSYWYILRTVLVKRNNVAQIEAQNSRRHLNVQDKRRQEIKVTFLVMAVIILWFLAWTPYAVVALMGIFDLHQMITPLTSMVPALFCKTASCCDPFIYALMHPKFRDAIGKMCAPRRRYESGRAVNCLAFSPFSSSIVGRAKVNLQRDISKISRCTSDLSLEMTTMNRGRDATRNYWWYKPNFSNRSSSWKTVKSMTHRSRSADSDIQEDVVEEFVIQSLH